MERACERIAITRSDLAGKRVAVVGLGVSGRSAAKLALERGAHVVGVDVNLRTKGLEQDRDIARIGLERTSTILGEEGFDVLERCDLIVLSPGVPATNVKVQHAKKSGIRIVSELGFAAECIPPKTRIVAITGTNGKSTVTTFTGQLLEAGGVPSFSGGNLGVPLSEASLALLRDPACYEALVVEVSSFMMEFPGSFHADVATILNLTPDHLERHGDMETYGSHKCRLLSPMTEDDVVLLPRDSFLERLAEEAGGTAKKAYMNETPGIQVEGEQKEAFVTLPGSSRRSVYDLTSLKAVGTHNLWNAGVALFLAEAAIPRLNSSILQPAIAKLKAPPHRMMVVGDHDGVVWIDDSKSTNVDSSCAGIGGLSQPAVVLLGGLGKNTKEGLGFAKLVPLLERHRAVVVFGRSAPQIEEELISAGRTCIRVEKMVDAVELATQLAKPGDAILLSPACASFDEYDNFVHRGRVFAELMRKHVG